MSKNESGLVRREDDVTAVGARVVESIVCKGDLALLEPEEMGTFYVEVCRSLGLNHLTQPLMPLRLNGKLILYATKNATDQLAARHHMSREITWGPEETTIGGKKYLRATCRATLPDGRVEVANGIVPLGADPGNDALKAETKAKRRAALSLLGLGLLDESEVADIPATAKAPASVPVFTSDSARERHAPTDGAGVCPDEVFDRLKDLGGVCTVEQAAGIYCDLKGETGQEDTVAMAVVLRQACGAKAAVFERACDAEKTRRSKPAAVSDKGDRYYQDGTVERAAPPAPPAPAEAPALAVDGMVYTPAQAERDYAAAQSRDEVTAIDAEVAALKLAKTSPARKALIAARKAAIARLSGPPDDDDGARKGPAANDAGEAHGDAYEGPDPEALAQASALKAYVDAKQNRYEIEHGIAKHRREWSRLSDRDVMHVAVPRLVELGMAEMSAVNALRVALNGSRARRAA